MKKLASLFMVLMLSFGAMADGILMSWAPTDMKGMTKERFEGTKAWSGEDILSKNLEVTEWPEAYLLLLASQQHINDKDFVSKLIEQVSDTSKAKLSNTGRLIIWERITSGDILFEGKGMQIEDDLFSVGGRANWILRTLLKKNFGYIKMHTTKDAAQQLQQKWKDHSAGKKVPAYEDPYPTDETGLSEIRSLDALQALIVSLKESDAKTKLTRDCLQRLYHRDDLPADKDDPANFCNPDNYTNSYLMALTNEKDVHDAEWWMKWWNENKEKLVWNKKEGKFFVKEK